MELPVNLFMWLIASLPIVALILLMIKFHWGAEKAAPVGLAISLVSAITVYKSGWRLLIVEISKGLWEGMVVFLIIWSAILLYEVVNEADAFPVVRTSIQKATANELMQILIFGWVFVSFLQGVTGFGVPIAIGAPLLIGIGVSPLWSVFILLVGGAWANTFGTLGVAWEALLLQINSDGNPELLVHSAFWAALFIWIVNFLAGIIICWIYGKKEGLLKGLPAVVIISLVQGGGQLFLSVLEPSLAVFIPTTLAMFASFLLGKSKWYRDEWSIADSQVMDRTEGGKSAEKRPVRMTVSQAFFPYIFLTLIVLIVLLVKPLNAWLSHISLGFTFPEVSTGYGYVNEEVAAYSPIQPFAHVSTFLMLSAVVGFVYYRKHDLLPTGKGKRIIALSIKKATPAGIAIIGFIIMSQVMSGTGQIIVLAEGISQVLGETYALFAAGIGMLGSFMTSSNMSSNILFGKFQQTAAELLELAPGPVLGAQTTGATIGNIISPGNIILGTTTAGVLGQEGKILKKVLPMSLIIVSLIGIVLYLCLVFF